MLTWREDVEADALHKRGRSISAIARHLDRDRKTIRAYLAGDCTPGVRRDERPDPLAPFAAHLAARFVDDPHIWASALYDEVTRLGYDAAPSPACPTSSSPSAPTSTPTTTAVSRSCGPRRPTRSSTTANHQRY